MDKQLADAAQALGDILLKLELKLTTAESCTSGLVSMTMGSTHGSADFFTTGIVTYSNSAKQRMLNVSERTLRIDSAVSEAAVREMATGALALSGEDVSLAISGYAGPDGGEDGTPAGTIWFAWQLPHQQLHSTVRLIEGDCEQVIRDAALFSLQTLTQLLQAFAATR
ncbi:CinA family protein [Winslowiella arboricola]|uniref:CinA family protein n=1 Tax=Winslowiella arboricola TaxID=2978220 RepID=UPI00225E3FBD|nr:CinA family protein [Winslowiella arboricola]MCU5775300.1 CinA family protein [Winslowiella arboricola]